MEHRNLEHVKQKQWENVKQKTNKQTNPQSLQQDTTSLLRRSPARQFRGANCLESGGGGDEVGQEADWVGSGGDSRAGLESTFLGY